MITIRNIADKLFHSNKDSSVQEEPLQVTIVEIGESNKRVAVENNRKEDMHYWEVYNSKKSSGKLSSTF